MKKKIITAVFVMVLMLACLTIVGCSRQKFVQSIEFTPNQKVEIYEDCFEFSKYTITVHYLDGSSRNVPITEEMIAPTEQVKLHKQGQWTVEVTYLGLKTSFEATVTQAEIEDFFTLDEEITLTYDGLPHTFRVEDDVPAGLTLYYPNGYSFIDVGVYDYKVVVMGDGYQTMTKSSTITIKKADYDLDGSGRVFASGEKFIYDGLEKTVKVTNLPKNLTVTYTTYKVNADGSEEKVNSAIDAGEYAVYAHYTCSDKKNYNAIRDERATFTIEKIPYNLFKLRFVPATFVYNGEERKIALNDVSLLPEGVTVEYSAYRLDGETQTPVDKMIDVGKYKVVAKFAVTDQNYEPIKDMEATLTITKAEIDMSAVRFEPIDVPFDGKGHTISVSDNLPQHVVVTYSDTSPKYSAGSYTVVAKFSLDTPKNDNNYSLSVTELTSWIIIEKIEDRIPFDESNLSYDVVNERIVVTGVKDGVIVTVKTYSDQSRKNEVKSLESGKEYYYTAEFAYEDEVKQKSCYVTPVKGVWLVG